MPSLDDGDLDRHGQPVNAPLTPPNEPEYGYRGSVLDGTVAKGVEHIQQSASLQSQPPTEDGSVHVTEEVSPLDSRPNSTTTQPFVTPLHDPNLRGGLAISSEARSSINGSESRAREGSAGQGAATGPRPFLRKPSDEPTPELSKSPEPRVVALLSPTLSDTQTDSDSVTPAFQTPLLPLEEGRVLQTRSPSARDASRRASHDRAYEARRPRNLTIDVGSDKIVVENGATTGRPRVPRALSTPASIKSPDGSAPKEYRKARASSRSDQPRPRNLSPSRHPLPSPIPATLPMPPLSLSTYLQLELSSSRPSQLYIHRPSTSDFPYESSRVKIERLLNFLFLPVQLETVLWFGVLACLDMWLYTFTILPLRMVKSIYILSQSFVQKLANEARFVLSFVYTGTQRVWSRRRTRGHSGVAVLSRTNSESQIPQQRASKVKARSTKVHRRQKSTPSNLMPDDKADILKGFLIIATCAILLRFDASRMYHWVRGQAAIKLYVIYNLLEVCDRLLSALGQDVLECLFSREALERKPDGHSKILRPLWLFILALVYCVTHATALFYQVVTLNVAVNSYSNALITLLMSNQFVEIKGTVFKKFEKENLFQLTCADVVERFQLWHMLMIIASRNIVETGAFNIGGSKLLAPGASATATDGPNVTLAAPPISAASILPRSFMILPSMLSSMGSYVPALSHVLGPFIIVLGSEMFIDWLKHAYIGKFNNTRPIIYARFLDILAKDYYTNAFSEQNLTKRLGLPVIPLCCLMIRAGFQTYQMFVASWVPAPSSSTAATLASIQQQFSTTRPEPTTTAGIIVRKMDDILNQLPTSISNSQFSSYFTTILILLLMFLVLLVCKLTLGMCLLAISRARYRSMKEREQASHPSPYIEGGRRAGGWGTVEVDDEKRRIIYDDDPGALQALKAKEAKSKARQEQESDKYHGYESSLFPIRRFELSAGAKRIW